MPENKLPVVVKSFSEPYRNLILDSWTNSMCFATTQYFWVPNKIIMSNYRRFVGKLLDVRPSFFRVLVNEENKDQVFGWACYGENILYFTYVKEKFRREGLASMLVPGLNHEEIVCSSWSKACEYIKHLHYRPSFFKKIIKEMGA